MNTAEAAIEVGPIIFGQQSFRVKDRVVRYDQVKNLSWYWFSNTVNFINTQKAELSIFIRGTNEEIKVSKHTMYVSPKLAEAYRILRERTWDYRIQDYLVEMSRRGCFTYEGVVFYTDGTIRSGSDVFLLRNASVQAFNLCVKLGGIFSRRLSISLRLDHDIIHTLFEKFLKSSESPSDYVTRIQTAHEQHEAERHWFFDTIRLCAKLAVADGSVDPDEILVIKEFVRMLFDVDETMMRRAIKLFNEARASHRPAQFYAQRLYAHHGHDRNLMGMILNLLRDVVFSDGALHVAEQLILEDVARIFGIDEKRRTQDAHDGSGRHNDYHDGKRHDGGGTANRVYSSDEERYANVLGLSGKVTADIIRKAYRKLVIMHHPDKLSNASKIDQQLAHDRMVELNAAYDFFKRKYGF